MSRSQKLSHLTYNKAVSTPGRLLHNLNHTPAPAANAALPPPDPSDPTAKALGFVNDATKIDSKTHPTFKAGQKCSTCAQFQGQASDATAACTIFAGKSVPAGGWCQVWAQKG